MATTDKIGGLLGAAAVQGVGKLPGGPSTATDANNDRTLLKSATKRERKVPDSDFESVMQNLLHNPNDPAK